MRLMSKQPYVESGVWPICLDITGLDTNYDELDASLAKALGEMYIHNPASVPLIFATGSAGNEVPFFVAPPLSSIKFPVEEVLKKGVRLAVKTKAGTVASGYLSVNGFIA